MTSLVRAAAATVIALGLFSRPDPDVAAGNRHFEAGELQEALEAYKRARPQSAAERRRLSFNRGTALLRLGEYGEAREALREAQGDPDATLRSRASFNEGNARFMMKDHAAAARAFRRALVADPKFEPARRNLELTLRALMQPDAGTPDGGGQDGGGDGGGDGGAGEAGAPQRDGGVGDGGGGGGGGDGGSRDSGQGDGGSPASQEQKPQPAPQPPREITEQDALRLLDSLRDAEQDQMLMRFLQQAEPERAPEKTW